MLLLGDDTSSLLEEDVSLLDDVDDELSEEETSDELPDDDEDAGSLEFTEEDVSLLLEDPYSSARTDGAGRVAVSDAPMKTAIRKRDTKRTVDIEKLK